MISTKILIITIAVKKLKMERTNIIHVEDHDQGSQLIECRQSLDGKLLVQMSHRYRDIGCVILCVDGPTVCQGKIKSHFELKSDLENASSFHFDQLQRNIH